MGDHRWRGYSHEELHKMINSGPGVAASIPLEDKWAALSETLGQIDTTIHEGLTKVGASWEGASADAATAALSPLAAWATDAGQGADTMKASAHLQGGYIADARKEMPEPVQVVTEAPSTGDKVLGALAGPAGIMHVVNQQNDHEAEEAAQDNAEQKAITVMNNYQSNSEWNSDTLGQFVPPPKVVIDTPPPSGAGTYNNTSANYVSASSSTYTPSGGGDGTTTTSWTPPPSAPTPVGQAPVVPGGTTTPTWTPPPSQPPVTLPPVQPTPPPGGGLPQPPGAFPPPGSGPIRPPVKGGPVPPGGLRPVANGPGGRPGAPGGFRPGGPGGPGGLGGPGGTGGANGPGGRGGFGGAPGGPGQGGVGGPNGPGGQFGRAGGFGPGGANGGFGPGGANGPGGRPGQGPGGMGAGGRGGDGEEDGEHKIADYLVETDDVFGDDRMVAPPVIGETPQQ